MLNPVVTTLDPNDFKTNLAKCLGKFGSGNGRKLAHRFEMKVLPSHLHGHLLNSYKLGVRSVVVILKTEGNRLTDPDIEFIKGTSLGVATLQGRHARNEPSF